MQFVKLSLHHDDVVHDIAFDYYGNRFVTCSSDKKIKVWDQNEDSGEWICCDISGAHLDSIWRLSWAHPEFGQLFASCSEDKTVQIWEEQDVVNVDSESKGRWQMKAQLTDSKKAVNDVKFSPRHLGLKIASASSDGIIRIYEPTDLLALTNWCLQSYFHAEPIISGRERDSTTELSDFGATCISWDECPFDITRMVVGGYSKRAAIWMCDAAGHWQQEVVLESHGDVVNDVSWAPSMGRSYHLIATASRENSFKIHVLQRKEVVGGSGSTLEYDTKASQTIKASSEVWRVSWNATGTLLATSAEDGTLGLWRRDFDGKWINVQQFQSGFEPVRSFYST